MELQPLNVVVAFIQPFQLEQVVDALRRLPNFPGISVSEVRGFGRHGAHPPQHGEQAEVDPFEKKTRLEIYCQGTEVTSIIEAIRDSARTGHPGDGKIFAADVAWAIRIRTGELGGAALLGGPQPGLDD